MVRLVFQDKNWEGVGSDENDDSDESLDLSDDDESFYAKKPKGRQQGKVRKSIKSTRDRKSGVASGRQRRLKSSFEDNESTTEDSDSDSDGDFKSTRKKSFNVRKNNNRFSVTSFSTHNSDVRTSRRAVRKISYVESDESEEADEGKKKKPQKVNPSSYIFEHSLCLVSLGVCMCKYFGVYLSTKTH